MVYTTLKKLRNIRACKNQYMFLEKTLGRNYGDNTPIDLCKILEINGLDDIFEIPELALQGDEIQRRFRLFAVACCQIILDLMDDQRSRDAIRIGHLYAYGEATDEDLLIAEGPAFDAACACDLESLLTLAKDAACEVVSADAFAAANGASWAVEMAVSHSDRFKFVRHEIREYFKIIFSANFD